MTGEESAGVAGACDSVLIGRPDPFLLDVDIVGDGISRPCVAGITDYFHGMQFSCVVDEGIEDTDFGSISYDVWLIMSPKTIPSISKHIPHLLAHFKSK